MVGGTSKAGRYLHIVGTKGELEGHLEDNKITLRLFDRSGKNFGYNVMTALYGLYFAKDNIKELDSVIIMEGYFDVISSQAHGIKNCVASCGTSLTSDHIKLMSRYTKSRKIFLSFDTDAAGLKAANRGGALIKEAFEGLGDIKQFDASFSETLKIV